MKEISTECVFFESFDLNDFLIWLLNENIVVAI